MTSHTDRPASHPATGRLTLDEAAAVLGISHDAIRGRVRRGTLTAERVHGRWLVDLAGHPATQPATRPLAAQVAGQPAASQAAAARDELVARLEADVLFLQGALEREQTANAELRRLLAMHLPALDAPTPPERHESVPNDAEVVETPRRRWWAFWRA